MVSYFILVFIPLEPLYVAIEFVPGGSLDKLLRRSRVQRARKQEQLSYANIWSRLTERQLLRVASDVANGMQHLESKLVSHTLTYSCMGLQFECVTVYRING